MGNEINPIYLIGTEKEKLEEFFSEKFGLESQYLYSPYFLDRLEAEAKGQILSIRHIRNQAVHEGQTDLDLAQFQSQIKRARKAIEIYKGEEYGAATLGSASIERFLTEEFGATGAGLTEKTRSVQRSLSKRMIRRLNDLARIRNDVVKNRGLIEPSIYGFEAETEAVLQALCGVRDDPLLWLKRLFRILRSDDDSPGTTARSSKRSGPASSFRRKVVSAASLLGLAILGGAFVVAYWYPPCTVSAVQLKLTRELFDVGTIDGIAEARTRAALRQFISATPELQREATPKAVCRAMGLRYVDKVSFGGLLD